VAAADVGGGD